MEERSSGSPSANASVPCNQVAPGAVPIEAPPQLTPKLIWVPVNPLIAPPFEVVPNFTAWHSQWLQAVESKASSGDAGSIQGELRRPQ
eukprot:s4085_g7.t1